MMQIKGIVYGFFLLAMAGCFSLEQNGAAFRHISPGNWRGVFSFEGEADRVPITFTVKNTDQPGQPIEITFGSERLGLLQPDSLRFWGDTLYCYFDKQQAYLKLTYEVNLMEGHLYDRRERYYPIKFLAQSGAYSRFPDLYEAAPVTAGRLGRWTMHLANPNDTAWTAAATLTVLPAQTSDGNTVYGQLEVTTDSSLTMQVAMEGVVQKDKIYLSGFTGKDVVYLSGTLLDTDYIDNGALRLNRQTYYWNAKKTGGQTQ